MYVARLIELQMVFVDVMHTARVLALIMIVSRCSL